jgi:outer membrane protein assembly factor BamA
MKKCLLLPIFGKFMKTIFLLFLCLLVHRSIAQVDTVKAPIIIDKLFDTADKMLDLVSVKSWTFIPAVTYSPETSLGLGVRALKIFPDQEGSIARPSTLPITLLYTLNRQIVFTTALDLWLNGNETHLSGRLELMDYPFRYYGIGNELVEEKVESYASRNAHLQINYQKRIAGGIYLGPRYEFRIDDIYKKQSGGMLDSEQVAGSNGQQISGVGLLLNYDTRDNIFQPLKGSFHQVSLMGFHSIWGSKFNFGHYQIDFRKYFRVYNQQVFAAQAWYSFTSGHPPFQRISLIGGSDLMRGYFEGKFRDFHAMVYQAEYRLPLYRKLGLVLFGSAGQVADKVTGYSLRRFRYGGGLGLRYQLTDEGLNFRLDIAFGDQPALYFGLNEVL